MDVSLLTQAFLDLDLLGWAKVPVIVNITSGLASLMLQSEPTWIFAAYILVAFGSSKTALNAYTVFLAHELREQHFKVNALDPSQMATDFTGHQGGEVTDTLPSAPTAPLGSTLAKMHRSARLKACSSKSVIAA